MQQVFEFLLNQFDGDLMMISRILSTHCSSDIPSNLLEFSAFLTSLEMKSNYRPPQKFNVFWKLMPTATYPILHHIASKVLTLWGSTYCCESIFSTMKYVKSSYWSSLSDANLDNVLQIASMDRNPAYKNCRSKQSHLSH